MKAESRKQISRRAAFKAIFTAAIGALALPVSAMMGTVTPCRFFMLLMELPDGEIQEAGPPYTSLPEVAAWWNGISPEPDGTRFWAEPVPEAVVRIYYAEHICWWKTYQGGKYARNAREMERELRELLAGEL